ncbi:MAG: hypothetical protein ABIY47_17115 [Opitutaceae bacterium]
MPTSAVTRMKPAPRRAAPVAKKPPSRARKSFKFELTEEDLALDNAISAAAAHRLDSPPQKFRFSRVATQQDKAGYMRLLRRNPQQSAPALPTTALTLAKLHRYKERLRAFDAARLELKLASPVQIQRENSAVKTAFRPRIVRFSQHA